MDNIWILAQAESEEAPSSIGPTPVGEEGESTTKQPADSNAPPPSRPRGPFGGGSWIFIGLMFVLMYFILFRGPRKKQQQHKQMVQTLQKNDRVRTIGGIIGTVVDVKDDEITLKVDESNNTKIKVAPSAIGRNLSKDNK
jgi:preprotein translocase subunit YajC